MQVIMGNNRVLHRTPSSISRKASWRKFVVWLIIGSVCAISVAASCNFLFSLVLPSKVVIPIEGLLTLVFFIAIIRGGGDKLVARPKPRYKYRPGQNELRPLINWPRFRYGFGVAFLVCFFWIECQSIYQVLYFHCFVSENDMFGCATDYSSVLGFILSNLSDIFLP